MIASARQNYAEVAFRVDDARTFRLDRAQDAIFSNATLHWIPEADMVVERVHETLRRSGRFVAEFGGAGNVEAIVSAAKSVLEPEGLFSWPNQYYPTAEAYAEVLEQGGCAFGGSNWYPDLPSCKEKRVSVHGYACSEASCSIGYRPTGWIHH